MMVLDVEHLSVILGSQKIIHDVNIHIKNKAFVGLMGINGAGKSSLLKAVYGINHYSGQIKLKGKDIKSIPLKKQAQNMAVLIQETASGFDFKVKDVVMLGRLPYKKLFDEDTIEDHKIVMESLHYVGMDSFADRYFSSLSGGEKQRVLIARILAQKTDFLILDEPMNHLDVKNQFQFFKMIQGLHFTVFSVLHDLNMAAKFCDYLYVLHEGTIYTEGMPRDVLTTDILYNVFGMKAQIHTTAGGEIYIEYMGVAK